MLTGFHTYAYKKTIKVVTVRILASLSGWIQALQKAVCSPLEKILLYTHKKLVTGNEATVHLVERDCKFAMFWPPDQESVPTMPA